MRQILFIKLALIATMIVNSCELGDSRAPLNSLLETTWIFTLTNQDNITASSVLKYDLKSYNIVTTYTKDGRSFLQSIGGTYIYNTPNVTMVSEDDEKSDVVVGIVHEGRMYIEESHYVFERQN